MVKATYSQAIKVQNTLRLLRHHEFKPVALHFKSKAAVGRDYTEQRYIPPPDDYWTNNNYGVGCVTGPSYQGPIDVDLDCMEAIEIAPKFFPETQAVFGRKSKPNSHRIYRVAVTSFPSLKFQDPVTKDCILELRGDGEKGAMQTVFPGSLHEGTGEEVEWAAGSADFIINVVPDIELVRCAKWTAVAVLIRRHIWLPGSRNDASMALAGMLYKLDWKLEDVLTLLRAALGSEFDTKAEYRVRHTYDRADSGKIVNGSGKLYEMYDKALIDKLRQWVGTDELNIVEEYNERYSVTMFGSACCVVDHRVAPSQSLEFMSQKDFFAFRQNDFIVEGDKIIQKAKRWFNHPRRRQFEGVELAPGEDTTVFRYGKTLLNLWTGWAVQPVAGDCSAWLELVRDVICGGDDELSKWLLHWFANIVREPQNKPLTCPVVIGVEGAGKTLFVTYFGRILGPTAYTPVTQERSIHGNFNAHMATCLLLHSEEALRPEDKKHAAIIRGLITDPFMQLERKNIDSVSVRSFLRLLITSNDFHPAQAMPGDRRFTIINIGDRKISDELRDRVLKEMEGDGPAALLHYLLNMEYDSEIPRTNIKNDNLLNVKLGGLDPYATWWHERLALGQVLDDQLMGFTRSDNDDNWPRIVSLRAIYASVRRFFRDNNIRKQFNEKQCKQYIEKCTGAKFEVSVLSYNDFMGEDPSVPREFVHLGGRQQSITNMPTLDECRAAFDKFMGQPMDWPADHSTPATGSKPKLVTPVDSVRKV